MHEDISSVSKIGMTILLAVFLIATFCIILIPIVEVNSDGNILIKQSEVESVNDYPPFDGISIMEDGSLRYTDEVTKEMNVFNFFMISMLALVVMCIVGKIILNIVYITYPNILRRKYMEEEQEEQSNYSSSDIDDYLYDDDSRYSWVDELLQQDIE